MTRSWKQDAIRSAAATHRTEHPEPVAGCPWCRQPFDLRDVVDRTLDRSSEPHPRDLARDALMRIPFEHREAALLRALESYIEARIYERQEGPQSCE